ncbi:helix-turn-helix domain-containing protein [Microbacterium sp. STN6]|uniref:helix-turn-helix transcriptional regulator n=1 Tax=Microbacterium sp. STN6 TaxID=2995588 RepID=UPI002260E9DF|nr:helix-turn-helix domain-containing protein [Microbacterium sp. STN6]MCX7522350.1 helix-turn-helix domain-containing protein [Microbacterium sp. STN6]
MTTVSNSESQHAALASRTRREILEAIAASPTPLGALEIADSMRLHVTTVRFHLDQLEAANLIRRNIEREGRRGRPRVVYAAAAVHHERQANRQLIDVLAGALASDADGGKSRAIDAGRDWAEHLLAGAEQAAQSDDRDALAPLMGVLDSVGFEPELDAQPPLPAPGESAGRAIRLLACPFREAALDHPAVVCSVHRGLIRGTLEHFGNDVDDASLKPFVQPELCAVTLRGALG